MSKYVRIVAGDILEHAAFRTWAELGHDPGTIEQIEVLRRREKSAVYRLAAAGPQGCSVIAKRASPQRLWIEHAVYAHILPELAIPALRCFGFVVEANREFGWLFIEDAGGKEYRPQPGEHADLIARYLAVVHGEASHVSAAGRLPDRGPNHYLEHLRTCRTAASESLSSPLLHAHDLARLGDIIAQLDSLEARWTHIERFCDRMPRTLAHGDFAPKNLRVRSTPAGPAVLLFDWETAGWSVPAADLAQLGVIQYLQSVDLARYHATVRDYWPQLNGQDVEELATVGTVFRLLAMLAWESLELSYASPQKTMARLEVYRIALTQALQKLS